MILVIGLDGADWRILDPWLAQGYLPTLARLKVQSGWGELLSTLRPESSVAWSTFATGVNPGKHGVFGFVGQEPHRLDVHLNTGASVRALTVWQWAAAAGRRVALLNVPMTYPPQPIPQGAVVAGMLTPDLHSPFTQPPSLREALLRAVPDYTINVEYTGMDLPTFLQATTRAIQARGRAARWLLEQDAWDLFLVVFTATDRLQHHAFHLLHPEHPQHQPEQAQRLMPQLLAAYQAIDQAIEALWTAAGSKSTVVLLSDHGFGPVARAFYINEFLAQAGWLTWHPRPSRPGLWQRLRRHPRLRRLKRALPGVRQVRRPPSPAPWLHTIDWSRTRVFYSPTGGLRFNLRGREPKGIVPPEALEELRQALSQQLLALRDPLTGQAPIARIAPRESLYQGPWVHLAPDLILDPPRDGWHPWENMVIRAGPGPALFGDTYPITGNHASRGILAVVGPDVQAGPWPAARLEDLAPTLLHLLGLTPPSAMDGRVLPGVGGRATEATPWAGPPSSRTEEALTREEQERLQERLRSLGYL